VVLHLEDLTLGGAVATLVGMTRLDDFRPTPESRKAFDDLLLASEVWSALTMDQHTRSANIRVLADDGSVLVTGSAGSERVVKGDPRGGRAGTRRGGEQRGRRRRSLAVVRGVRR
jgi:hypothetical protein